MSNVPPAGEQPGWSNPSPSQPPPNHGGGDYGPQGDYASSGPPQPSNGIGIAAMVVGIVALVLSWIPFLGLVLGIVGLVLGILGIRKVNRREATNKGMAITGVVTGAIATLIGAFFTIATIAIFDEIGNLSECMAEATTAEEQRECEERFEDDIAR